jgi:hypothetical protein
MKLTIFDKSISNKKTFIILIILSFSIFIFTSDGHRTSFDEDVHQLGTLRLVTLEPHPLFVEGDSKMLFEYPSQFPQPLGTICQNEILCSQARIGQNILQYPFVFLSYNLGLNQNQVLLNSEDFDDPNYLLWRNNLDPTFILLEVAYGAVFSSLAIGVFFLVSRIYYSHQTSLILSLILALATPIWAYANTTYSVAPTIFFILVSFYFLKKFQQDNSKKSITVCSISLAMLFLIRPDNGLIIAPFFIMFIYDLTKKNKKIRNIIIFLIPLIISYLITKTVDVLNWGNNYWIKGSMTAQMSTVSEWLINPLSGTFGLLFSPGFGLFIFTPILFTIFLGYSKFFSGNKKDTIFFISIISTLLLFYGSTFWWYAGYSWSARYLLPIIPFMLIPIGIILESKSKKIFLLIIGLSSLGFFINFVNVIQDIQWFVWGFVSQFGLANLSDNWTYFHMHTSIPWTFENSPLVKTIELTFSNFQPDIFILKALGIEMYSILVISILLVTSIVIARILTNSNSIKLVVKK